MTKELNTGEPVAWMSQGGDVSRSKRYFEELGFTDLIPLHPVKELTDDVAKYHYNKGHEDGRKLVTGLAKELTDEEINSVWNKDLWKSKTPHLDFARAIIKEVRGK